MKKWILNVGLTTITVLPIVAVASCSSTTTESPSLTTEATKYENKTFPIKGSSTIKTPSAAIESINNASNQSAKLTALQNLVTLNVDTANFNYEVGEAKPGTNNSVEISMKIIVKTNTSSSQTVKFVINGFTQTEPSVQEEAKRFQKTEAANTASQSLKATDVIKTINDATDKLVEFEKLTTVPKPNTGFELKVISAQIGTEQTSVDVKLSIVQTGTDNTAEATFTITGFSALTAGEILEAQASRLVTQQVPSGKQGETPLQAKDAISTTNLDEYYTPITLSDGVTYSFVSAATNTTTNTTLDVTLSVKSTDETVTAITKIVEITGFTSPQTLLVAEGNKIVNQTVLSSKAGETAAQAALAITNDTTLKTYYAPIELGTGFSYAWKSDSAVGDTVSVVVTVTSTDPNTTPIEKTFTISGFKTALEAEAEKFATSLPAKTGLNGVITTRLVVSSLNQTADTQQKKLTAINALVDNFPSFNAGFALNIGTAAIAGENADTSTSVTITLTISQPGTSNSKVVTFTITGLAAETLQQETNRLATTHLVTKSVLAGKAGETAAQAVEGITDLTTLKTYYNLTPLPTGFEYNYVSDVADGDTVKVTLTVSTMSGETKITSTEKEVVITGFKTMALVNLEAEAAKLVDRATQVSGQTAAQAKVLLTNDSSFTTYYGSITLGSNFSLNYAGPSEVDKTDPTTLNVTMRVTNRNVTPAISMLKVVKITGFSTPSATETEALKFQTSTPAKTPSTLTMGVISVINGIGENQEQKLTALKAYATNVPTLSDGYTLSIGLAAPDATTPTSVNIPITISPNAPTEGSRTTPVTVIFTITGLTIGTPKQQLDTIAQLFNNRVVRDGKKNETAAVAQKNLTNDGALNMYYQNTTMPSQFTYSYGGLTQVNKTTTTTLNVTLRIAFSDGSLEMFKVVEISGFQALTPFETEAQKFAISAPLILAGTTTTTAISNINTVGDQPGKLAALKLLATLPTDESSYIIVIGQAKIDPTTPTSVIVPMRISKAGTDGAPNETPVSVNLIITGLTVPTVS